MISGLYKKDQYLNKNYSFLVSSNIIEYDIKQAGFNLAKYYKLLPNDQLNKLEKMPKDKIKRRLGIIQRDNKDFREASKQAFIDIRKEFFIANNLKDEDILSIKKDAIFTTKICHNTKFKNVEFRDKNSYSTYINMNDMEFYYNLNDILDIKGMKTEIKIKHEDYMIKFIKLMMHHLEIESQSVQLRYIRRFIDRYKNLELDIGYYRNFSRTSEYTMKDADEIIYSEANINDIDISYNYFNIILPLLNIII